jgi:4-amino-4-deoxy-L-arabinose transferase-like glycosyltransferase
MLSFRPPTSGMTKPGVPQESRFLRWSPARQAGLAAGIIFFGLFLRLYHIGYNFDGDEIFSVEAAKGSLENLFRIVIHDHVHPPLYYLLLHAWIKIFGSSEAVVRMLCVVFSLFFLICLLKLASRLMSFSFALVVVWICAASPFFVHYGRQARPYALAALMSVVTMLLWHKIWEHPRDLKWEVLYAAACMVTIYTQYLGLLILLPQLSILAYTNLSKHRRALLLACVGIGTIIPWLVLMGTGSARGGAANLAWIPQPTLRDIPSFYISVFGWLSVPKSGAIFLVVCAIALGCLAKEWPKVEVWKFAVVGTLAIIEPLAGYLASRFGPVSVWAGRQFIGSAVFFGFLIGLVLSLQRRWVAISLGSFFCLWPLVTFPKAFPERAYPPWRSLSALLSEKCGGCDVVSPDDWIRGPLAYYSQRTIYSLNEYQNLNKKSEELVFLCRPIRCAQWKEVYRNYRVIEQRTIMWDPDESPNTSSIQAYFVTVSP